jgi:putative transposase
LYEGPVELIGKQMELLFHEEERDLVEIRYKQQSYGILKLVDLNVNCRVKRDKNNDPVISGGNSTPQSGRIWEVES